MRAQALSRGWRQSGSAPRRAALSSEGGGTHLTVRQTPSALVGQGGGFELTEDRTL